MRALLSKTTFLHDQNAVCAANCGQSMGNDNGRAVLEQRFERLVKARLRVAVDASSCLVQDQKRCITVKGPSKGHQLAFAYRKAIPLSKHGRIQATALYDPGLPGISLTSIFASRNG